LNLFYLRSQKREARDTHMPLGGQYVILFYGYSSRVLDGVIFLEVNNGDQGLELIGGWVDGKMIAL